MPPWRGIQRRHTASRRPFQAQHKLANEKAGEVISGTYAFVLERTHMKIAVIYGEALTQATPLLALGVWESESLPGAVANLIEDGDWNGKFKQTTLLYPRGEIPARRVLLIGLGTRGQITFDRVCEAAAVAAQQARSLQVDQFAF